jgi:hypothetical protein
MRKHYGETKAQRQAAWMAAFADLVATAAPSLAGRIDWPTAHHFYFSGMTPEAAARQYLEGRT